MNFIDIFIAAAFLVFGWIGFRRGILRTVISVIGLCVGGGLAVVTTPNVQALLSKYSLGFIPSIGLTFIIIGASLGLFLFGILGSFLRIVLLPFAFLKLIDSIIGLIISITTVATIAWTLATAAQVIPNKTIKSAFDSSIIIDEIELYLPSQIKSLGDRLQNNLSISPLTEVFRSLVESRITSDEAPKDVEIPQKVEISINSVVKIEGIAESCSAALVGTGFIVAPERIITNAHVIAGVTDPVVTASNSNIQLAGRVTGIDRQKDLALIYVPGLSGEALIFMGPVSPKEVGFVAGYPNGGSLRTTPVSITSEFESIGKDIDNQGEVNREVIVFGGEIKPGNSGGPLFNEIGQVIGMVFAADAENENTGYALTPNEITSFLSQERFKVESIGTGSCAKTS
jgi:S1-C subfamily serine protease